MQLDIFEHSRDVVLRNVVAQAIEQHDAMAARDAADRLEAEFPGADTLPAMRALIDIMDAALGRETFRIHDELRQARLDLEASTDHASRVLGSKSATGWLARRWRNLAERAERLPFDPRCAEDHAALLWLRARDWRAAERAVATIASWRRIPVPLAWMTEARLGLVGLRSTWPLVAELAWLSPKRLAALAQRSPDQVLKKLLDEFGSHFDGEDGVDDLAWFPAWLLTHRSDLRDCLAEAQASRDTAPERTTRVLVELIGYERQGRHHEVVAMRQALRDLHPRLFEQYMRIR